MSEPAAKPTWVRWRYGWGETWRIARGIELTVGKGESRGDGFYWSVLNIRSEANLETIDVAKAEAIKMATSILKQGLAEISPTAT